MVIFKKCSASSIQCRGEKTACHMGELFQAARRRCRSPEPRTCTKTMPEGSPSGGPILGGSVATVQAESLPVQQRSSGLIRTIWPLGELVSSRNCGIHRWAPQMTPPRFRHICTKACHFRIRGVRSLPAGALPDLRRRFQGHSPAHSLPGRSRSFARHSRCEGPEACSAFSNLHEAKSRASRRGQLQAAASYGGMKVPISLVLAAHDKGQGPL